MTIGPDKLTASREIDKINYGRSFNVLENANASEYLQGMSYKDIIAHNMKGATFKNADDKAKFFAMLSNIFQSVTTKGFTTYEILEYIANSVSSFKDEDDKNFVRNKLKDYIVVFHKDYLDEFDVKQKETLKNILYCKDSDIKDAYGWRDNDDNKVNYDTTHYVNFSKDRKSGPVINKEHKNPSKSKPSLSAILLNNKNLRCGTRNALEISSFFNLITTLEYAKAYPFFNATFILPNQSKQDVTNVFKTATLNQFMFGSNQERTTNNYRDFEGTIIKDKDKIGVNTNLSVFMHPQTMVNMNEKTGHRDVYNSNDKRLRITSIHDKTRPFMTLKDFTIDVSPTKGLMSFKTGKMSLILHDRTRMADIAPFIKPDLFGAFGAEIAVEYGWIHNSGQEKDKSGNFINPIGAFLDSSRCIEKYIIVNSQFTIENNGQVNINLSIAMKGPVDVRQTEIFSDAELKYNRNGIDNAISDYKFNFDELNSLNNTVTTAKTFNLNSIQNVFIGKKVSKKSESNFNKLKRRLNKAISAYNSLKFNSDTVKFGGVSFEEVKIVSNRTNTLSLLKSYYSSNFKTNGNQIKHEHSLAEGKKVKKLLNNINQNLKDILVIFEEISNKIKNFDEESKNFVDSLIAGVDKSDMFYDTLSTIAVGANIDEAKKRYVTLGSIITSITGTHMISMKKYDEVQIIFHTVNERAGKASKIDLAITGEDGITTNVNRCLNIASIPVRKDYLEDFLSKIFENKTRLTIESLISQIIVNFVLTKDNPAYGLSTLFSRKKFDSPVKEVAPKNKNSKVDRVAEKLNKIYYGEQKELYESDPKFIPPSIHLTFDALTNPNDDSFERTICRITVYDRNDNPYQEMSNIYNQKMLEGGKKITALSRLLREEKNLKSERESLQKKRKKDSKSKKRKRAKRVKAINKELAKEYSTTVISEKIRELTVGPNALFELVTENGETFYRFKEGVQFSDLKEKYKYIIPSATFATQNTALISASVATVNEAKLNTVYITRADRNKTSELNQNVLVDMPLRVLPAQASVEMFGCPWVNFGQYIFLDFETGTTIDNTYAVTGIQHTITPGKFTTRLSLSYGDVYGKYEGFADTFSQAINKLPKAPDDKTEKTKTKQENRRRNNIKTESQKSLEVNKSKSVPQTESVPQPESVSQPISQPVPQPPYASQTESVPQTESVSQPISQPVPQPVTQSNKLKLQNTYSFSFKAIFIRGGITINEFIKFSRIFKVKYGKPNLYSDEFINSYNNESKYKDIFSINSFFNKNHNKINEDYMQMILNSEFITFKIYHTMDPKYYESDQDLVSHKIKIKKSNYKMPGVRVKDLNNIEVSIYHKNNFENTENFSGVSIPLIFDMQSEDVLNKLNKEKIGFKEDHEHNKIDNFIGKKQDYLIELQDLRDLKVYEINLKVVKRIFCKLDFDSNLLINPSYSLNFLGKEDTGKLFHSYDLNHDFNKVFMIDRHFDLSGSLSENVGKQISETLDNCFFTMKLKGEKRAYRIKLDDQFVFHQGFDRLNQLLRFRDYILEDILFDKYYRELFRIFDMDSNILSNTEFEGFKVLNEDVSKSIDQSNAFEKIKEAKKQTKETEKSIKSKTKQKPITVKDIIYEQKDEYSLEEIIKIYYGYIPNENMRVYYNDKYKSIKNEDKDAIDKKQHANLVNEYIKRIKNNDFPPKDSKDKDFYKSKTDYQLSCIFLMISKRKHPKEFKSFMFEILNYIKNKNKLRDRLKKLKKIR